MTAKLPVSLSLTCLISIAYSAISPAQSTQTHGSIEKYLDSKTVLVAWLDVSRVNITELAKFLDQLAIAAVPQDDLQRFSTIQAALVQLKVSNVYVVGDFANLFAGHSLMVFPCENSKALALLLQSLVDPREFHFIDEGTAVIGGPSDAIAILREKKGAASAELLAAIEANKGPHGIAFAVPPSAKTAIDGVFNSLIKQGDDREIDELTKSLASIRWMSLSATLPPTELKFEVRAKDHASAEAISKLASSYFMKQLTEQSRPIAFNVAGDSIVLDNSTLDDSKNLLATIQRIATYSTRSIASSMKQIALALHNYADTYGRFPPQSLVDQGGNRLLSWRVLILPYIDEKPLYQQFHLDEPWDSPHNLKLAAQMPAVYASPGIAENKTTRLALLSKDSVFGRPGIPIKFTDIGDGLSNTIWFVDADRSHAVVWTKPEDLIVDEQNPVASIIDQNSRRFWASMVDGSVRSFARELSTEHLNAIISIDGKERFDWNAIK